MKDNIKIVIYKIAEKILYVLAFFMPLKKRVVFSNFSGKRYGDNPKYISEKFHEMYPDYELIWLEKAGYHIEAPDYVTIVRWGSFRMITSLLTSKVWVDSHLKPLWCPKRKKQFYIETWHGGLGFKKIEKDVEDKMDKISIAASKHNTKLVDLLISNSEWLSDIYRRAFWGYDGEILLCGYPKEEVFYHVNPSVFSEVRSYFGIAKDVKLALYAPTFCETHPEGGPNFKKLDYEKLVAALEEKTGTPWVIIVRLHPLDIKMAEHAIDYTDKIINGSDYPGMQELTMASDLFITDYSSGIFDYAYMEKPGFLFAPDRKNYEEERGVYLSLENTPFPFAESTERLVDNVLSFDEEAYVSGLCDFMKEVQHVVPHNSAEQICKIMKEHLS